ncbi:MAG: glycoside hydrolase family 27 protein, partial [Sphingobacteriales bacterium]
CNTEGLSAEGAYKTITAALKKTGRPIVLSICEWGTSKPWTWASNVGHLWRTTGDIFNCFDCIEDHGSWKSWGAMQILDKQDGLRQYAGPGHWNDPDMLEVGNGMIYNEDKAHFAMWSMIAAPLIAGNDLRSMSKETIAILTNKEVVAVNQDSLGVQGFRHSVKDSVETWFKPLKNGEWAVCFLNRSKTTKPLTVNWADLSLKDELSKAELDTKTNVYAIRDLWLKKSAGNTKKTLNAKIPGHDVLMFRLSKN